MNASPDRSRFDELARILASDMPRRKAIKLAFGALLGASFTAAATQQAHAAGFCFGVGNPQCFGNICVQDSYLCLGGCCCPNNTECCPTEPDLCSRSCCDSAIERCLFSNGYVLCCPFGDDRIINNRCCNAGRECWLSNGSHVCCPLGQKCAGKKCCPVDKICNKDNCCSQSETCCDGLCQPIGSDKNCDGKCLKCVRPQRCVNGVCVHLK